MLLTLLQLNLNGPAVIFPVPASAQVSYPPVVAIAPIPKS